MSAVSVLIALAWLVCIVVPVSKIDFSSDTSHALARVPAQCFMHLSVISIGQTPKQGEQGGDGDAEEARLIKFGA